MSETIYYDDDPATTEAEAWLKTTLGKRTIETASAGGHINRMLIRAFRTGFVMGQKRREGDDDN